MTTQVISVTMLKAKETKGTWQFKEIEGGNESLIGTLYVPKTTLEKLGNPDKITVKVEVNK